MKKLIILSAITISGLIYNTADAQIGIHLGFHFGPARVIYTHAPVVVESAPVYDQSEQVYDNSNDDYYYLPDVDAYYDVNQQCYFYNDGDNWISAAYLPGAYRDYDWRNARRYEVRAPRPYMHNDFYRSRYNGHPVGEWAHVNYDNHFRGGYGYANHFNRDAYRENDQHFDNRAPNYNQHFDNRRQGGFNQFAQPNRGQEMNNNQHFDNRGQGGSPQPSNQNNYHRDNRGGGDDHFAQNNSRGGSFSQRMSRY